MSVSAFFPLDSDGFLRRECPHCAREFKWHSGPANEEAESAPAATAYFCPLCGEPAGLDQWLTQLQVELCQNAAVPMALQFVEDELASMFRGSKHMSIKSGGTEYPDVISLVEIDDMQIVTSPCHGYEPVKVSDGHDGPVHCLICGSPFAV